MKKVLLAGVAALTIAGSTVVYAQHRPWFHSQMRMSPEDRAAFLDARIAGVHAGLKLTADQEKLWPPVEAAVRDFAKMRIDRANARMAADKADADKPDAGQAEKPENPVARLRERAENMGATAAALTKIADAADPLYKTLDDGQKRRLTMLTHMEGRGFGAEGWRRHRLERGMDRWERGSRDHDRFDRDHFDHDGGPDQERSGRL
ncbi:Spy/CpxP family protein refolding chaperone [Bradyrhizobium jicamae]|uniref:Spy/CpxP family protein refolding chaperone n=1 Tax=Bradyrhizobium jicamae TaxID=280332 RepID=UPI001BABD46F|nr:Spy/CpxP family protein refolding chaperone [Bradyrhizobium jicamae]MBR0938520.1 Spy/CpxP family protein refolding chaperone [Bradyrhizobium jicamae]